MKHFYRALAVLFLLSIGFDQIGTFDIHGYTFRFTHIILFVLFVLGLRDVFADKSVLFGFFQRKGIVAAVVFLILCFLSLVNSEAPSRTLMYSLWCAVNVAGYLFAARLLYARVGLRFIIVTFVIIDIFYFFVNMIQLFMITILNIKSPFVGSYWPGIDLPRLYAFFFEPSYFGAHTLIAIGIIMTFILRGVKFVGRRWMNWPILVTLVVSMFLGSSRTGWVSFAFLVLVSVGSCLVYKPRGWKKRVGVILGVTTAFMLVAGSATYFAAKKRFSSAVFKTGFDNVVISTMNPEKYKLGSSYKRLVSYRMAFKMFLDHPLVGVGIGGSYAYALKKHRHDLSVVSGLVNFIYLDFCSRKPDLLEVCSMGLSPYEFIVPEESTLKEIPEIRDRYYAENPESTVLAGGAAPISNAWLEVLAETGFMGFLAVLAMFLVALYNAYMGFRKSDNSFERAAYHGLSVSLIGFMGFSLLFTQTILRNDIWFLLSLLL